MTDAEVRRDYVPLVRDHVKRAHGVICVSEYTAREAQLLLDVPKEKIAVIPNGVDPAYRAPVTEAEVSEVLARRQLPRGAILYVGSQEKRKNLVNLAMAYLGLSRKRRRLPPLLMVGPGPEWTQGGSVFGSQITATGYMETREIRALMAASALLVLPSLEEGFGLPVAEAMAAGLPVVCSRGSALEEVAGGAATLVDPLDAGSIAAGIEKVLESPSTAESQRQRGLEWSRQFDWDVAARKTLEFYRQSPGRVIIGVDARELAGRPTGTGRYLRSLLRRWTEGESGDRFVLYFNGRAPDDAILAHASVLPRALTHVAVHPLVWQESHLPAAVRGDAVDVFFSPAYTCPLRLRVPRVTAVHDLSFFSVPWDFSWREALRRRVSTGLSIRASRRILACSAFTRREITVPLPRCERSRAGDPPRPGRGPAAGTTAGTRRGRVSVSRVPWSSPSGPC